MKLQYYACEIDVWMVCLIAKVRMSCMYAQFRVNIPHAIFLVAKELSLKLGIMESDCGLEFLVLSKDKLPMRCSNPLLNLNLNLNNNNNNNTCTILPL